MAKNSCVIGENEDGTDFTIGDLCKMVKETTDEFFTRKGLGDRNVKVGALIIKEEGFK